jgi:uncharacterized membrane protein YhaH (DUF805 family)
MTDMPDNIAYRGARPKLFSLAGRLGRVRYIVYSLGAIVGAFLMMLLVGVGVTLLGAFGRMLYMVISVVLFYALLPMFFAILTVKRAHDFNMGGWLALLLLVPVVNLMFWFIPGTRGENAHGAPGEPTSLGFKLIALILPPLLIAAFLSSNGTEHKLENPEFSPLPPSTPMPEYKP